MTDRLMTRILTPARYDRICDLVAVQFGVTPFQIRLPIRGIPKLHAARFASWYIAFTSTNATYEEIGQFAQGRHHTTIMNGLRRAEEWQSTTPAYWEATMSARKLFLLEEKPDTPQLPTEAQRLRRVLDSIGKALGLSEPYDYSIFPVRIATLRSQVEVLEWDHE